MYGGKEKVYFLIKGRLNTRIYYLLLLKHIFIILKFIHIIFYTMIIADHTFTLIATFQTFFYTGIFSAIAVFIRTI